MSKPLTILVDLDGTVVDLMSVWIDCYNAEMAEDDEEVRIEDVAGQLDKHVKAGKRIYDFLNREGWFRHLPELDGAVAAVEALHQQGHRIVICTSPGKSLYAPSDKFAWVDEHMPFLKLPDDLIIAHDKHLVCADVLIDDNPRKAGPYKERWPEAKVIGMAWPYNRAEARLFDLRADSYLDPRKSWATMRDWVEKLARSP
jgi:5'(3')-deoxyribonucleotidase